MRWSQVSCATVVIALAILQWLVRGTPAPVYTPVPITSAIGQDSGVTWSPEEEFIAFARVNKGSCDGALTQSDDARIDFLVVDFPASIKIYCVQQKKGGAACA